MEHVRVRRAELEAFCAGIFRQLGLAQADAQIAAQVLVAADARGIPSHGVARLGRYVNGLTSGVVDPRAQPETLSDTPTSIALDARGAMGAPVSARAMETVIRKAGTTGAAFGCVRNSNHFGIAGYYAMMALAHDMIGIAMTNTAALGVPTFGRQVMFGTNPIAFAAPADRERGFVLDMATTVVTRGKIEVYDRLGEPLPSGWAVDKTGRPAADAHNLLDDMFRRVGGGIMPLGGTGELFGGHKGYGLAVMVDILCAVLCGAPFGSSVADTARSSGRVSHFFGAVRIDTFRDPDAFRKDMDRMLAELRQSPPAEDAERVYYAGLKEFEHEEDAARTGVSILRATYEQNAEIGRQYGISPPVPVT
ncbi:MAG: Ldh family oxidoreductase [Anaerolineae bacterium]|nr:Ldh family oxidoreductase [Anaerolineae bacterium]